MSIKDLVNKAKEIEDHSEVQAGGDYTYEPPKAGRTVGRFIEYIELGKHIETYDGKPKPAAELVRVTFEFTMPDRIKEIEVEGGTKKIAERISMTMPKKFTEKAKFFKLFNAMTYGRENITHMAEMLGEAFIFDIKHNTKGEGDKKQTFANIYTAGAFGIFAPRRVDDLAGTSEDISGQIPPALSPLRIFLWNVPTKETWDTLFIDGESEKKNADGTTTKVSKNWLQERILSATDYVGSGLEQLLNGLRELPTENVKESTAETEQVGETKAETKVETASADDLMKALNLG